MTYDLNDLTRYEGADLANFICHFTYRRRDTSSDPLPNRLPVKPSGRLAQILRQGRIQANPTHATGAASVCCFSEATRNAVSVLVKEGTIKGWGLAFDRQYLFEQNGGPCWYVRGDEWDEVRDALPSSLQYRCVRYWPGASASDTSTLPHAIRSRSDFIHEREWRIEGDLCFEIEDVAFVILQAFEHQTAAQRLEWFSHEVFPDEPDRQRLVRHLSQRTVVMGADGEVTDGPSEFLEVGSQ